MQQTHPLAKPAPRRQIDAMEGDDFTISAAVTQGTSIFPACVRHEVTIEKPGFTKALVLHGQGEPPVAGMEAKRKRVSDGFAIIWADAAGKVIGGGYTTGAVPRDWRVPPKPKAVTEGAA